MPSLMFTALPVPTIVNHSNATKIADPNNPILGSSSAASFRKGG